MDYMLVHTNTAVSVVLGRVKPAEMDRGGCMKRKKGLFILLFV